MKSLFRQNRFRAALQDAERGLVDARRAVVNMLHTAPFFTLSLRERVRVRAPGRRDAPTPTLSQGERGQEVTP